MCEGYIGEPPRYSHMSWELGEKVNEARDTDRLPYIGKWMMARFYGRDDTYELSGGRTLTLWEQRRERTLPGRILMGQFATSHVCLIDLAEKPWRDQRHYTQLAVTDVLPIPEVNTGIRATNDSVNYDSLTRMFERQSGLVEPTTEQIMLIDKALAEAAERHPKFGDNWA